MCWVFSAPGQTDVVTIYGQTTVTWLEAYAEKWDQLMEAARPYAMTALSDTSNPEYRVLETVVSRCEYLSPRRTMFHPTPVSLPSVPRSRSG